MNRPFDRVSHTARPRPLVTTRPAPAARQAMLREHNLAVVAHAIVEAPSPVSRADVAAATGLTRATVSALVDRLVTARILQELPPATALRAGRPAVPLVPAPRTIVGLGLEVNVDYLGGQILDLAGEVVAEQVEHGDFHASDPGVALGRLRGIARGLIHQVHDGDMRLAGTRLALPGLVDADSGRLQVAPNLGWSQVDPAALLDLPGVKVINEAKLAAIAQIGQTAAAAPRSFLYVNGDVGVGSAIVVDGHLFHGRHGWAGEIGHVVVDPAGPPCPCGARGCLEQFAGKHAVLRGSGLGLGADLDHILALLAAEHPGATSALQAAGAALGSALADYINLVDVDTVLLGGFYPSFLPYLAPAISDVLATRVLGAPWAPVKVTSAPVTRLAAITGGAREVLRGVLDNPTAWL